ncbi:MAG: hypothetical protein AB7F86_18610 [Bdellovibrionales bacterium]
MKQSFVFAKFDESVKVLDMLDPADAFKSMQLQSADGTRFQATWTVPADLPYFKGHFPGMPIFPAVGIVDATLYLVRQHLKTSHLSLAHFTNAKFLSPIEPGHRVEILAQTVGPEEWSVDWRSGEKLLSQLRFRCAPRNGLGRQ